MAEREAAREVAREVAGKAVAVMAVVTVEEMEAAVMVEAAMAEGTAAEARVAVATAAEKAVAAKAAVGKEAAKVVEVTEAETAECRTPRQHSNALLTVHGLAAAKYPVVVAHCGHVLLTWPAVSALLPGPDHLILKLAACVASGHQLDRRAKPRAILLAALERLEPRCVSKAAAHVQL